MNSHDPACDQSTGSGLCTCEYAAHQERQTAAPARPEGLDIALLKGLCQNMMTGPWTSSHAKFIVAARTALPLLIAHVESLERALAIYADHANWSCNRCKGHDHLNCCLTRWDGPLGKEENVEMCGEAHGYSIAEQALERALAEKAG